MKHAKLDSQIALLGGRAKRYHIHGLLFFSAFAHSIAGNYNDAHPTSLIVPGPGVFIRFINLDIYRSDYWH